MLEIHARFGRLLPDTCTIKEPSFITIDGPDGPSIDFANRFFTPVKYADSQKIELPAEIAAWNNLSNAERLGYVYTEDNRVRFVEAEKKNDKWFV